MKVKEELNDVKENVKVVKKETCDGCNDETCEHKTESDGKKIEDIMAKVKANPLQGPPTEIIVGKMTPEDFQYFQKLGHQEINFVRSIAMLEIQKSDAIIGLKNLGSKLREFEQQIFEKYNLKENSNFRVNPQTMEIVIRQENKKI